MTKERRLELQEELEGYLEGEKGVSDPSFHVSFQPPEGTKIKYPHIVYSLDPAYKVRADNLVYLRKDHYEAILISRDPDSEIFDKLDDRAYTAHTRSFVNDGLHHYVFDLYH